MDPKTLALIQMLLGVALQLYESQQQIEGNIPIPSWEELTSKNALLQAKIDAEK